MSKDNKEKISLLHLPDLHLLDKETSSTLKQAENTIVMLDKIIDTVKSDEGIKIVTFGGDIQDRVPTKLYYIDLWKLKFKELADIISLRQKESNIKIKYIGLTEEQKELESIGKLTPLVSSKGNHDYVKKMIRSTTDVNGDKINKDYTFFDSLVNENIIINPKAFALKVNGENIYFDNRNFGEADRELPSKITDKFKVIASYHDNVVTSESSLWQINSKDLYEAEEVLKGVDLGLVNHIHKNQDPLIIKGSDGEDSVLWQIGSLGRMKMNDDETRSVGYAGIISLEDFEDISLVELDLIPMEEYFNFEKVMKRRNLVNSRKQLSLGTTHIVRNDIKPSDEISNLNKGDLDLTDLDDELFEKMKGTAVKILEELD